MADEKTLDETTKPTLIHLIGTFTKQAAIQVGVIGTTIVGTLGLTADKYDDNAHISVREDTLKVAENIVSRPYVSFDTVVSPETILNKNVTYTISIEGVIFYEQIQHINNAPILPNDAFCLSYAGYIREDRTKIDSTEIKPELERE